MAELCEMIYSMAGAFHMPRLQRNPSTVQLLPAQIEAGKGTAIFTGATASLRGGPKFALLAAPKFALRALAQSTAREFQSKVLLVTHLQPL